MIPLFLYILTLQTATEPLTKSLNTISDNGIMGAFLVVLIVSMFFIVKYMKASNEKFVAILLKSNESKENENKNIEKEFRDYIIEMNTKLTELQLISNNIIKSNTVAYNHLINVIENIHKQ